MIKKKIVALVAAGCLTASIGVTAVAYTKNVSSNSKVKYNQAQGQGKLENGQKDIKTKLDTLVKAGTITQAVEDKVILYFNQMETQRKAEMDKVKSMTAAERKTYMDSKVKGQRLDPLADMVKSGTITQAEADSINAVLPQGRGAHGFQGRGTGRPGFGNVKPGDMQSNMKSKIDALVKAGTITQAIEDKVIATYNQMDIDRKAEMDKVSKMTAAERKTYMDSKVKGQRVDPLADLVKNGTLTQAQADAINKLQVGNHGGPGGPGGHGGGHGTFGGRH